MSKNQLATEALHAILASGNYRGISEDVVDVLKGGADPDGIKRNGWPLRRAVDLKNPKILAALLAHGADLTLRTKLFDAEPDLQRLSHNNLDTVLHYAVYQGCKFARNGETSWAKRMLLELIAAGADPQTKSAYGMGCIDLAKAEAGNSQVVPSTLALPLHAAVSLNDPDLCLRLLERGIDGDERNPRRQTAWRNAELNAPECYAVMSAWRSRQTLMRIARSSSAPIHP